MEVNAAGYSVIPRYMGWEEFLAHTRAVLDCGNHMYIQVTDPDTLETKYLLDHVKAMHID